MNTHTHNYILAIVIFLQPSAVQPSALPYLKASRSTGDSAAGLWVVEAERCRCGDEGRRGEA